MAFMNSAGVNVSEIDLTTIIPSVATSVGAYAGMFNWGPINKVLTVASEVDLASRFTTPDTNTFVHFFTCANFLSYTGNLKVVRTAAANLKNATANSAASVLVQNEDAYQYTYVNGSSNAYGPWIARYAGHLGNSIKVSICPSSNAYTSLVPSMLATCNIGNTTVNFTGANAVTTFIVGDLVKVGTNGFLSVSSVTDANTVIVSSSPTANAVAQTTTRKWQYADQFQSTPGTSDFASSRGGSGDEMHIIVLDEDGLFTGTRGTILEKFAFVSKASDAKNNDGSGNYYRDVLQFRSKYVYWADHIATGSNFGSTAVGTAFTGTAFTNPLLPVTSSLAGGLTDTPTDANTITSWGLFADVDAQNINLILSGPANATVATYLISSIAEIRRDCVVYLSPLQANAVNNAGNEATDIVTFRNTLPSSSYAFLDSGWKYQFDKYNNVYRYVPLNGDTAGTAAYTDKVRDPWFSHAGFNRGNIKNVTRLSWNPSSQATRDTLYSAGINPVVSFQGQGTVLYGDKTLLSKPSAFDRINVRRLFIILEKTISTASRYSLFEFNDEFTRAQFVNLIAPYLREIKGRRGITDFRVVCDTTNNTPEVIDSNQFIGDIYIKPARSINFIQLNFVATRTGVEFQEIVGKF